MEFIRNKFAKPIHQVAPARSAVGRIVKDNNEDELMRFEELKLFMAWCSRVLKIVKCLDESSAQIAPYQRIGNNKNNLSLFVAVIKIGLNVQGLSLGGRLYKQDKPVKRAMT